MTSPCTRIVCPRPRIACTRPHRVCSKVCIACVRPHSTCTKIFTAKLKTPMSYKEFTRKYTRNFYKEFKTHERCPCDVMVCKNYTRGVYEKFLRRVRALPWHTQHAHEVLQSLHHMDPQQHGVDKTTPHDV